MADDGQATGEEEHYQYGGPMADMESLPTAVASPMVYSAARANNSIYHVSQFATLRKNQEMRSDAPMSEQRYAGHSHEELHGMVNENMDKDTADTAGEIAAEIGNWLADVSTKMRNAIKQQQVEWQGEAADKARGLFTANAEWSDGTSEAAWLVANRYQEQSQTAATARSEMPEPTHFDQQEEMQKVKEQFASGDLGGAVDTLNSIPKKQQEADEKHQEAVRVMQNMDQGYHQTATTQPAFSPPPEPAEASSTGTSSAGYVPAGSGGGTSPVSVGGGGSAATPSMGAPSGGGSSVTSAPSTGGNAPGTSSGSYSGTGPVRSGSPVGNTGTPGSASPSTSTARPGGAAAMPPGGGNLRNVGSETSRPGLGRSGNSSTARPGSSSAAPRATGNTAGGGERSAAGRATGSEPGTSKGPVARGGAAAARTSDPSSTSGRPMAGAPGGRGGGGDDDNDHERKYEFGEDPDEIFGDDVEYTEDGHRIVPPVIGG